MTEKRFKNVGKDILQYSEWWCSAGGEHCADVIATAMNELIKENEQLKQAYTQLEHRHSLLHDECIDAECDRDSYRKDIVSLEKENEQLKQSIKEVVELLSEEVDVFSEKATEHDIIAYRELNQLDNKDAYYMATATKKAIKMLKELVE